MAQKTTSTGRELTMSRAMVEAVADEMREDEEVFLMGEDVADYGGIFSSATGLREEFGYDRVMDVPISETSYIGAGVGAAQAGMRPIVELMFADFFGVAMDQIYNNMAKNTYMSGGAVNVPMVLTTAVGGTYNDAAALPDAVRDVRAPPGDEGRRSEYGPRREGIDAFGDSRRRSGRVHVPQAPDGAGLDALTGRSEDRGSRRPLRDSLRRS